ncbi:polyamine ABC transporter substrate-binding protein [uncultured Aquitalea sp.]|uniref:polyamine ABC transporter substrate-binding protein n=1 Tax=uncultured Aquitalea sp. TaxID=540272 RepID=UPI0025FA78B5|nr:polyamine ABC transporter substrate-binding protein [uncultured Aquitalea sp.]
MRSFLPRLTAALCTLLLAAPTFAEEAQVNVYNWSDYIAKDAVSNFEKESRIRVKYDIFDTDETLQAKLLSGKAGYDVVVPSSTFMAKQIEAGVYMKLDKSKLPNLSHLDPVLMKIVATMDPHNLYGVPYAWGTTGLGLNVTKLQKLLGKDAPLESFDIVFKPEYLSKVNCGVSMLDSPTDVFPLVLKYIGKDPNSKSQADYHAAYEVLKKLRPYITQFNSSGYINDLANGDICLAVGYSGDVNIARNRAREARKPYEVRYQMVKGNTPIWFDLMGIPKDANHPEAAHKWINYILRPDVSASITNEVFYPSANLAAKKTIRPEIVNDPNVYPSEAQLKGMYVELPVSSELTRLMNRLWSEYKSGR